MPNGAGEERRRGDRSLLLQGKVGYRIAPSSVTFGDSFPPRGSLRRCYTPATQFILARPLLPQNANPNQGTYMGTVIAPPPGQCGTNPKTSERQQAGHKTRGPGAQPRPSFSPFLGRNGDPRRAGGAPGALRSKGSFGAAHPKGTQERDAPGRWSGLDHRRLEPAAWFPARSRAGDPGFL